MTDKPQNTNTTEREGVTEGGTSCKGGSPTSPTTNICPVCDNHKPYDREFCMACISYCNEQIRRRDAQKEVDKIEKRIKMWCYENPKEAAAEINRLRDWLKWIAVDDQAAQDALDGKPARTTEP